MKEDYSLRGFAKGLEILASYDPKGMDRSCEMLAAEHDMISTDVSEVSDEHAAELELLGWHLSSYVNSWAYFV